MLASLLYHTNQIVDVQVKTVDYFHDKVVFHVLYKPSKLFCPCCNHEEHTEKGAKIRKLRMAPFGAKPAFLSVELHRLKCGNCGHVWWPIMPFVRPKKRVTSSFEQYVIELMQFATIEHVAKFTRVSWSLVKNIHKAFLQREYQSPDFQSL